MAQARGGFDLVLDLLRATARDLLVPGCVGGGVAVSSSPVSSSRANSRMVCSMRSRLSPPSVSKRRTRL
jgi:hypothetical protein